VKITAALPLEAAHLLLQNTVLLVFTFFISHLFTTQNGQIYPVLRVEWTNLERSDKQVNK